MRILICKPNSYIRDELIEYFQGLNWESDIASDPGAIYQSLSREKYDIAFYNVSALDDFAQIRYINENYPEIKVIVSVEPSLGNAIENVRVGSYQSISVPLLLNDLGQCLSAVIKPNKAWINKASLANAKSMVDHIMKLTTNDIHTNIDVEEKQ